MVDLTFSTVVKTEGLVTSSKCLRKPTMKVTGEDLLSKTVDKDLKASLKKPQKADAKPQDDEEESGMIH
jgi:hypothetical protein